MNKLLLFLIGGIILLGIFWKAQKPRMAVVQTDTQESTVNPEEKIPNGIEDLRIETLQKKADSYTGSDITIQQQLPAGSDYTRAIVSYISDGNKIYALLTIPNGTKPASGWPVVVFNHGYIPPKEYKTTERYEAYTDAFSRNGYIVFKPDYRGNGNSEGKAVGAYGSNGYTIDVLNAVTSLKRFPDADPTRIGMWGHSMGGFITLRAMVVSKDIKAWVIWGGVVGSYTDMLSHWTRRDSPPPQPTGARRWRQVLLDTYGTPEKNPVFWNSISAVNYVAQISGPVQLHHSTTDESVPVVFSQHLRDALEKNGQVVQYFEYPGDNHNISNNLYLALNRSVAFFDTYLK